MPELKELRVVVGYTPGNDTVLVGDILEPWDTYGAVTKIEEKSTWCYFTLGVLSPVRRKLPIGSEVNVVREVETEDEAMWARADRLLERVKARHQKAQDEYHYRLQRMIKVTKDADATLSYPFDLDMAFNLAISQEERAIWMHVMADTNYLIEDHRNDPRVAAIRAVCSMRERCLRDLTAPHNFRVTSRSTSLSANITEDLRLQAKATFIDTFKYETDPEALLAFVTKED